eukprot:TRINITY_DN61502_c0_g1_i1.p1 TRINITY_DN61502_c0_g1~~TRINITY_DN61502_c0_g1_i1.p1  ORF type:complete len:337 (+),score=36.04 TRINITY_DN61502_c0_g1_i1:40-1011(+)
METCTALDVGLWHLLPPNPTEPLLLRLGSVLRSCGVIFLQPIVVDMFFLRHLSAAVGNLTTDSICEDVSRGVESVNFSEHSKRCRAKQRAKQAVLVAAESGIAPGRGRLVWLPKAPRSYNRIRGDYFEPGEPFGDAVLDLVGSVGPVVRAAWKGSRVDLDFLAAMRSPAGASAQPFHRDSNSNFAKLQLVLHSHGEADGALTFILPNISSIGDSRGQLGTPVGLPGGVATAGAMIIYFGSTLHAGSANHGVAAKKVIDVSFRRGTESGELHQEDTSGFLHGQCHGAGLCACEWNERRRARWTERGLGIGSGGHLAQGKAVPAR